MINMVFLMHLIFAIVATAFFIWQFATNKMPYQLVLIFWIPSTLLKYLSDKPSYLIKIGILEIVFLLFFIVCVIIGKLKKSKKAENKIMQINAEALSSESGLDNEE